MVKRAPKPETQQKEAGTSAVPKPRTRAPRVSKATVVEPALAQPALDAPKQPNGLHELALAILADALVPTPDQVKALAAGVLKLTKPKKAKKGKAAKSKDGNSATKQEKKAKSKVKDPKRGKAAGKKADTKEPMVRLPKPKSR